MQQILSLVRGLDGVLELAPTAGDPYPEIAWGDHFFFYAPDRQLPGREQPFATIVTKDYPDDARCDLDGPGRWRLNIHVGTRALAGLVGPEGVHGSDVTDRTGLDGGEPVGLARHTADLAAEDVVIAHPVYAAQGWAAIVVPGPRTSGLATDLLRSAHADARRRATRRLP